MSDKARTIRIFDDKTDDSVIIITDVKKSRIRELIDAKGSFWDNMKKIEDSLRTENCMYKCVFDSRTDKEDVADAIGWSDAIDIHEDTSELFETTKNRLFSRITSALRGTDMSVIDGDNDSMIIRASSCAYQFDFLLTVKEA